MSFLNVKEACKYLNMSDRTLYNACQRGDIIYYKAQGVNARLRFKESDLLAYMEKSKHEVKDHV